MKKVYETPSTEIVKFQYRDQVVAASAGVVTGCELIWYNLNLSTTPDCYTNHEYRGLGGPGAAG